MEFVWVLSVAALAGTANAPPARTAMPDMAACAKAAEAINGHVAGVIAFCGVLPVTSAEAPAHPAAWRFK